MSIGKVSVVLCVLLHFLDTTSTVVLSELILKHLYIRFYNDMFCDVLILSFGTPLFQWLTRREAHLLRAQQGIPVSEYGVNPETLISVLLENCDSVVLTM